MVSTKWLRFSLLIESQTKLKLILAYKKTLGFGPLLLMFTIKFNEFATIPFYSQHSN